MLVCDASEGDKRNWSKCSIYFVTDKFRQFDYGLIGNLKRYNKLTPPDYDLSKVTAPVALIYSSNDKLVAVKVRHIC